MANTTVSQGLGGSETTEVLRSFADVTRKSSLMIKLFHFK